MTRALLALIALGLCSCATPRVAPRFDKPSTQPIAKGIADTRKHIVSAKKTATHIAQQEKDPALKLQVAYLVANLDTALKTLDSSEVARKQLDVRLGQQTAKANKLATDYDNVHKKLDEQDKIIRQVNSKWGLGAFAYGFQRLARHLLILAAVAIGLLIAISVLGLIFPAFGAVLKIAGTFISSVFSRILRRQ